MQTMSEQRWTVTDLTRYVREKFELDYRLQDLEVEGEVSDFRIPGSGHAYFTLKDAGAQLRCVMWRSEVQSQSYLPQHGDHVIARGQLSVYEAGGQYQLYCRRLRPAGQGDLHAQFEELKARLQEEGLFDAERKRPIPERPHTIGIVTSPSTAALQDVLNVLSRRSPLARVVLSPAPVQGDQAPPQIVAAIEAINALPGVDVLLVVRGGGSLEDLWCFNDERVARAVAASAIPVISGVGHEIDFTLCDFAADLRAPTPSAAAELATPITRDDLLVGVQAARLRAFAATAASLVDLRRAVERSAHSLRRLSPQARITGVRQQVDMLLVRAVHAARADLSLRRAALDGLRRTLNGVSPSNTLARGYAIVRGADGRVLRSARSAPPGSRVDIRLYRGTLSATVDRQETEDE
jgi:exodeoxyribonuclease VII large subunit